MRAYEGTGHETVAWRLKLSEREIVSLFDLLRSDYVLSTPSTLKYTGREYDSFFYNCAQYACDKILESAEGFKGYLADIIQVAGKTPIITNHVIYFLRDLGILGAVERGLQAPGNASTNVVVYWIYTPPK